MPMCEGCFAEPQDYASSGDYFLGKNVLCKKYGLQLSIAEFPGKIYCITLLGRPWPCAKLYLNPDGHFARLGWCLSLF
jgi:hypothetical protein